METPGDSDGGQAAEQNEQGQASKADGEKADDVSDGDGEQNDATEAASEAGRSSARQEASDGDGEVQGKSSNRRRGRVAPPPVLIWP